MMMECSNNNPSSRFPFSLFRSVPASSSTKGPSLHAESVALIKEKGTLARTLSQTTPRAAAVRHICVEHEGRPSRPIGEERHTTAGHAQRSAEEGEAGETAARTGSDTWASARVP